jgi:hypothetical protein
MLIYVGRTCPFHGYFPQNSPCRLSPARVKSAAPIGGPSATQRALSLVQNRWYFLRIAVKSGRSSKPMLLHGLSQTTSSKAFATNCHARSWVPNWSLRNRGLEVRILSGVFYCLTTSCDQTRRQLLALFCCDHRSFELIVSPVVELFDSVDRHSRTRDIKNTAAFSVKLHTGSSSLFPGVSFYGEFAWALMALGALGRF